MTGILLPLVARGPSGAVALRAPKVGSWSDGPADGALVGPGSPLGTLKQLGRRFLLRVPEGVSGKVASRGRRDHAIPVAYGELLLEVAPLAAEASGPESTGVAAGRSAGARHLNAPTDGVFYGAPGPGAPPFVVAGQRVTAGQTVGLIEVMKTFNPIVYGGEGAPDEGEIVEVLVPDGSEVRAGQPLVSFR